MSDQGCSRQTPIAVIGGGCTEAVAAWRLAAAGLWVTLLDRCRQPGAGATRGGFMLRAMQQRLARRQECNHNAVPRSASGSWLRRWAAALRLGEALTMVGFPACGALLTMPLERTPTLAALGGCLIALALLSISVYAYNAWASYDPDRRDPKFDQLQTGGDARSGLLAASLLSLLAGLGGAVLTTPKLAPAAVALWLVWFVYSHPRGLKGRPFGGTLAHVVGGTLMVAIPCAAIECEPLRSTAVAIVLVAAFVAGHLTHECLDHEPDRANRLRTNAVAFGIGPTHLASLLLVLLYGGAGAAAGLAGVLTRAEGAVVAATSLLHLAAGAEAWRSGLGPAALLTYRRRYRLVFAAGCLLWGLIRLAGR